MTKILLVAALIIAGGARADNALRLRWEQPTASDWVLLGVAESLIVLDAAQTIHACNNPYAYHCEIGLGSIFMGSKPSTEAIIGTSIGAAAGTAVLWYVLPGVLRKGFIISVDVAEGLNVGAMFMF